MEIKRDLIFKAKYKMAHGKTKKENENLIYKIFDIEFIQFFLNDYTKKKKKLSTIQLFKMDIISYKMNISDVF